jgi:hypothetical protein
MCCPGNSDIYHRFVLSNQNGYEYTYCLHYRFEFMKCKSAREKLNKWDFITCITALTLVKVGENAWCIRPILKYIVYCILPSCYIRFTLNICSFRPSIQHSLFILFFYYSSTCFGLRRPSSGVIVDGRVRPKHVDE